MPNSEKIELLISPEALKQFEQLKAASDANTASFEKLIAKAVELNKAVGNATTFKEINKATTEMTANEKALTKQVDDLAKANAKLQALYADEAKKIAEVKAQQQARNQAIKEEIQLNQAAEGSIKQKQIQIKQLTREYDNLSSAERDSAKGNDLLKSIQQLDTELKKLEGASGRFQRNVGNYSGSAKIIVDALERAKTKFEGLSKAADATPAALSRAKSEFDALRQITDSKQFLGFAGKMGDAQAEVKTFTRVLVNLETQGEGNSETARELRQRLAELSDQIADTKDEVRALASDTRTFDLFAGAVSFAADTFQVFAGAATLAGASEEDAAEATRTLLAIQSVANGVKGIATELTTRGTAANKLYAFAQNQVAIAMDSTAAAGARLRGALITLGIGAVIIGIGLLIANFDKIKRAITGVSKEQEALNEVFKESGSEYTEAVKLVSQLKTNIDLAKQGIIQKEAVIKQYNDSLGKTTGQVKSLDEAEKQLIEKGDAYIQMTLKKAVANIALEKAAQKAFEAEELKRKKEEEFGNAVTTFNEANARAAGLTEDEITALKTEALTKRKNAAIAAKNDEQKIYTDIAKEAEKAMADIAKAFNLNPLGNNGTVQQSVQGKKFRDGMLKDDADMYKRLSENQDAYLTTRLSALEKSYSIEKQILAGQKNAELDNLNQQINIDRQRASVGEITKEDLIQKEKDFSFKRSEINKDYAERQKILERNNGREVIAIRQSFIATQMELDKEYNDQFKKYQEDRLNIQIDSIQKEQGLRQAYDSEGQSAEIKALNNRYERQFSATKEGSRKRQRVEEQYAKDRADIEYSYTIASIKNEIDAAKKILDVRKAAGIDVSEQQKKIYELEMQLSDAATKHFIENEKKKKSVFQERMEETEDVIAKVQEIEGQVANIIGGFISANVDKQKAAIQDQLDAIDRKKEADIDAVNVSAISAQDKANKIAAIDARAAAQKEALEKRQRQLDIQRAQFEKAANITGIVIETARAVVHQLAIGNLAGAISVGAIGAAQLALAIAAPLPKFAQGTDDAPGGLAWVGDGGKGELVITPQGQVMQTPSVPTVMNVPKHSIVLPDARAALESGMVVNRYGRLVQQDVGSHRIEQKLDHIAKVIKNKPVLNMNADQGGLTAMWQYGANWVTYADDQTRF